MAEKFELRLINSELTGSDEDLKVSGYVNKTNQWSQQLGVRKKFVERILPGTFNRALQAGNEIHFYAEHDPSKILATTRNGSLTLREDEQGLFMSATISDTSWGRDYHTLIKDGIIQNMSFGMKVLKDSWKKLSDGTYERSISDLFLGEVSAVRNPAYAQSTIAARSIEVIEDVEVPEVTEKQEGKRELTLEEELAVKRSLLKSTENLIRWGDTSQSTEAEKLRKEIRQMETTLNKKAESDTNIEERAVITTANPGAQTIPTDLIWENAKKMNGKHSLVARTNIVVQSSGIYEAFLQDAKNRNVNLFKGELTDLEMSTYSGQKVKIETKRIGSAMEVSELLLEKSSLEHQEKVCENTLRSDIEDSLNYAMLTGDGNMEGLSLDTSFSSIIQTAEISKVSLSDVFELESSLNHSYREGAEFTMHTDMFKKIRTNPEFKDHIEFEVDEVTGKKMYHLIGYPVVINDNAVVNRIIFSNLFEGYTTVISEGKKRVTQDLAGNPIDKTYYSFDLKKTSSTNRAITGTPLYLMDAHVGGKVINKDCFVRLDVKTA
ncbi:HK97 family phage prohead protease [Bacillus paranthracis]|uniref:HK97 family phage prohead protease n=1 Tax=Bacillus paranthracis TaxID=2026186 RepID=UPI00254E91A9|nr:HK97 family phage prohead protease [Bacillus paranthracis]MDK7419257.1 HK97 family phage prohead protease [Bacillus paranthracis]MDK7430878.1 HK97 family phage prohead protease [Bacillus paranthracis]MDK7516557.1 HK97 family phage prohead protease [Bacillus paranthracis]MDK7572391.1 HK97 family phage prohead protease [Bacillus paranthracis]